MKDSRSDAEASLNQVKEGEEALSALTAGRNAGTYQQIMTRAQELFRVTGERLQIEEGAIKANNEVRQKLRDVSGGLGGLDQKVKSLQSGLTGKYVKSVDATNLVIPKVKLIQGLQITCKDLEQIILRLQSAPDKAAVDKLYDEAFEQLNQIKMSAASSTADSGNGSGSVDLAQIQARVDAVVAARTAFLSKPGAEAQRKSDDSVNVALKDVSSYTAAVAARETELSAKYASESSQQADIFGQANEGTAVLNATSELTSLGLSAEALATSLFVVASLKEVDALQTSLADTFAKIDKTARTLDKTLGSLNAKQEQKMLATAMTQVGSMKTLLFANDGIVSKVRNQLAMKEKAASAMEGLRSIVLAQAQEAKKTMATAKGVQESSIIEVNRMILLSTLLVVVVGMASIVFGIGFGIWIYRSISKPLARLMIVTDDIAAGNLHTLISTSSHDEIGKVEASMGKMVGSLKDIVGKIRVATESLASSSEELSATARSLDEGSAAQSTQVEQAAGAMVEMSQTTDEVARNVSDTSQAASAMKKIALDGKQVVHASGTELDEVRRHGERIGPSGRIFRHKLP